MTEEFNPRTVLRIHNLPPSFVEFPLMKFFSQFGTVKRIKVSRSPKTLRSKGQAFIQFEDADVATEAQKAIDGYLVQNAILKVVQLEQGHAGMLIPTRYNGCKEAFLAKANVPITEESRKEWITKLEKIKEKWEAVIASAGIDYKVDPIIM